MRVLMPVSVTRGMKEIEITQTSAIAQQTTKLLRITTDWTYVRLGVVRCHSTAECFVGSSIPLSHHHNYLPALSLHIAGLWSVSNIRSESPWPCCCTDESSRCRRSSNIPLAAFLRIPKCARICPRGPSYPLQSMVILSCWWLFVSSGEWLRSSMLLATRLNQRVVLLFFVLRMCLNKSLKENAGLLWCLRFVVGLFTCDKHDRWQQCCERDPAKK